jgi:hypothetical protein
VPQRRILKERGSMGVMSGVGGGMMACPLLTLGRPLEDDTVYSQILKNILYVDMIRG